MKAPNSWRVAVILLLVLGSLAQPAAAQYFGRNKVQYRSFDFQVLRTDRFDLYYYPEEAEAARVVARMAERWHARLSRFFGHDLRGRQAIILYASGAHFRQTNAVDGLIGEGTGGVTEGIKRRVVLPMAGSLADTDHVLGHELVHAFQFDLTGADPRENTGEMAGILSYPLWFVEGMAEYLSLGPVDGQTAMWLRDSALREKLPHISQLDHPDYFPYRWGHAFWAYIGAKYGDRTVASLIRSAANPRFDLPGLARQLGTDPDTLTSDWHAAILASTRALSDLASPIASVPRLVIGRDKSGGRYNVGPRVSPDGRQVAFFSERDRFSVDLYLADVETGRIERKLVTSAADPHFDSLQFLNSAGAWSPDGLTLAIAAVRAGRPIVALVRTRDGRIFREIKLPELDDAMNPAFAPDGRSLVVSGNRGGAIDLYRVPMDEGAIEQLTHDAFADLEPVFTPDGRSIVFVTERFSTDFDLLEPGPLRLAAIDVSTKDVRPITAFLKGKHLSPVVSADGRSITFIADPDGVSNLYRMSIDGGVVERLSSMVTGIAGISASSPALSGSRDGRLVFSVFEDDGHAVYRLDPADIVTLVPPDAVQVAALLPGRSVPGGDVHVMLSNYERGLPPAGETPATEAYDHKLALDFVGQPMISGQVSSLGATFVGGMSAVFSDMLGDRSLGVQGQIGGTLADFGGQVMYLNRRHRWNWATSLASLPQSIGYLTYRRRPDVGETELSQIIERQTIRGAFGTAAFPFSTSSRLEVSGSAQSVSFSQEVRTNFYDSSSGDFLRRTRETVSLGSSLHLAQASVALVRDLSYYGATHPIYGSRARLEVGRTVGTVSYTTLVADWRRYYMPIRPWTVAVRGLHVGRYGRDSEHSQLLELYAGYPEFVHGYGIGSFSAAECFDGSDGAECDIFRSLLGSRLMVANLEVRAPLPGVFTGELDYWRLPIDLAFFADAGVSWTSDELPTFAGGLRRVVRSVGGAVRFNLFGILALEVAGSRPFDRVDRSMQWQIGIRQGF